MTKMNWAKARGFKSYEQAFPAVGHHILSQFKRGKPGMAVNTPPSVGGSHA